MLRCAVLRNQILNRHFVIGVCSRRRWRRNFFSANDGISSLDVGVEIFVVRLCIRFLCSEVVRYKSARRLKLRRTWLVLWLFRSSIFLFCWCRYCFFVSLEVVAIRLHRISRECLGWPRLLSVWGLKSYWARIEGVVSRKFSNTRERNANRGERSKKWSGLWRVKKRFKEGKRNMFLMSFTNKPKEMAGPVKRLRRASGRTCALSQLKKQAKFSLSVHHQAFRDGSANSVMLRARFILPANVASAVPRPYGLYCHRGQRQQ